MRSSRDLFYINGHIPFGSMAALEQNCSSSGGWHFIQPPLPPFSHTRGEKFDWENVINV